MGKNNRRKMAGIGIILCLLILAAAIGIIKGRNPSGGSKAGTEESGLSAIENSSDCPEGESGQEDRTETVSKEEQTKETNDAGESERESGTKEQSGKPDQKTQESSEEEKNTTKSAEEKSSSEKNELSFPCTVPGTSLTIQKIGAYSGIFLEDGSDQEIDHVTTIVLTNTGHTNVEYASITLEREGETLEFEASDIPNGASVTVQEKNQTIYQEGAYSACEGIAAEIEDFEMSEDMVSVEETEKGALKVTNLTSETIPCVRIFYKFYMEEENAYIGGITYTAKLTELTAGSSETITPSHYSAGYSRIIMVRTYDSAD